MLEIKINSYDTSALLHLGAALTAMAKDRAEEDKDCTCAEPAPSVTKEDITQAVEKICQEVPAPPAPVMPTVPAPPTPPATIFGLDVIVDPTLPPGSVQMVGGGQTITVADGAPPAPPADTDAGWPDPPQPEQAATDHLDADGIPWDVRIHAGTKTRLKADNTWKLKPGVDKALVEQVKAELKGVQAVPVPTPPAATLADAVTVSATLQAPTGPTTFAELIKEVTSRITAGQMTPDQVNGAVSLVTNGQLTMCNQLAARQDLIPAVWSVLCQTA